MNGRRIVEALRKLVYAWKDDGGCMEKRCRSSNHQKVAQSPSDAQIVAAQGISEGIDDDTQPHHDGNRSKRGLRSHPRPV